MIKKTLVKSDYLKLNKHKLDQHVLNDIVNKLVEVYHPKLIYLFGSYAWGDPNKDSDIDLFVVVEKSSISMIERMRLGYTELMNIAKPIDLIVYTEKELNEKKDHPSSLSYKILHKGMVLYAAA